MSLIPLQMCGDEMKALSSPAALWRVIGLSQRGASHARRGAANQDSIHWLPEAGVGPPLIVSVSDGHGSKKHPRSGIGARLAVSAAEQAFLKMIENQTLNQPNLSMVKDTAEMKLPEQIVKRWREMVADHYRSNPFLPAELACLDSSVDADMVAAYGATLLSVLLSDQYIIYLQIGDGDIVTISERGDAERPLPEDKRLQGNLTTSLCSGKAWQDFRVKFQVLEDPLVPPVLVLLSTDGYANSFINDAGFMRVGQDLFARLHSGVFSEKLEGIAIRLGGWLQDTSSSGSGDDITLGLICREDAFNKNKRNEIEDENARQRDKGKIADSNNVGHTRKEVGNDSNA